MTTYLEDQRLLMIADIMKARKQSSLAFSKYIAGTRSYEGDDMLHMREAHFIVAVEPGNGKTMSELAESLGVTQGAVSQTASRLEKKGYLVRNRSDTNYRQIIARLTPKGTEFYRRHIEYDGREYAGIDRNYLAQFTDEELKLLTAYEKIMCRLFDDKNS